MAESQCGFQNKMSTTHAILNVLTASCDQYKGNSFVCAILLDFQKAFDTVFHTSLLSKFEHYGNREVAYKVMSSFLSERQQYLSHQDLQSK